MLLVNSCMGPTPSFTEASSLDPWLSVPVDSPLDPFRAGACHAIPGRFLRPTDISSTNGSLSDGCNERHSLSKWRGEERRHGG